MKLSCHGWRLELRPDLGGSITSLSSDERDVLRAAAPDIADPIESACFPLIPYANRIAKGRFAIDGVAYQLPLNFGDHPHSLHGLAWQAAWDVIDRRADTVTLEHTHGGSGGWSWSYRARQRVILAPGRATILLSLTNVDDSPMPAGLGLHPYFARNATTRLTARAEQMWLADDDMLPTEAVPADHFADWSRGAAIDGGGLIDNAFDGWDGCARIDHAGRTCLVEARGASAFHLYRPPNADFFCFEPVSHLPDAINRGGMTMLSPGETMTLEMRLIVDNGT